MDSYIIRIYRRNNNSRQNLVGLVELVETDEEKAFTNFEELRTILSSRQGRTGSREKNQDGAKDK